MVYHTADLVYTAYVYQTTNAGVTADWSDFDRYENDR